MIARIGLCLAALSLTGCYNYGFRGQSHQLMWGVDPAKDLEQIAQGKDSRARREAMIRVARYDVYHQADRKVAVPARAEIADRASLKQESHPLVRATAAQLLKQVGSEEQAGMLARDLKGDREIELKPEPSRVTRREAVRTLGFIGTRAQAPTLAAIMKDDPDPPTRKRAATALGRLGGKAAVAALIAGLGDRNESVIVASWEGLRRMTGQEFPPAEWPWRKWWNKHKDEPLRGEEKGRGRGSAARASRAGAEDTALAGRHRAADRTSTPDGPSGRR